MTDKNIPILEKLGVDIGYKTTHTKTITEADIAMFAEVSGDFNPVHMSEEYAQKTFFSGRIAHGVISLGLLSAAMTKYPGLTIFLSQSIKFLKPVRIGDTITAINESLETANAMVNRVKQGLEAEITAGRVPAGAPIRAPFNPAALSPREKIHYAIGGKV